MDSRIAGLVLLFCSYFTLNQSIVFAEVPVPKEQEKGYILTPVENAGENTITKFEMIDGVMTSKYYRVDLAKTEYVYPNSDTTKYYQWINNNGIKEFKEVSSPAEGNTTIIVNHDSYSYSRVENTVDTLSTPLDGNFIGQVIIDSTLSGLANAEGGAVYNSFGGTIGDITGYFIGNGAKATGGSTVSNESDALASGGAIYNSSGSTIGNIKGDFIGNSVEATGGIAYNSYSYTNAEASGGAIYNDSKIGNITGDFIGNSVTALGGKVELPSSDSMTPAMGTASGGAVYNSRRIGDITANFIGNSTDATGGISSYTVAQTRGGAIYNSFEGTISNIKGDFIGNSVKATGGIAYNSYSNANAEASGGAIYNDSKIGNITGDFIGNSVTAKGGIAKDTTANAEAFAEAFSLAYGGAIYNSNEIGNITGDFINNSASAIGGEANAFTTEAGASAYGGAIYNEAKIGTKEENDNIVGGIINSNFINNYAKAESNSSNAKAQGGAIYTNNDLNIIADNGTSIFSGNKTIETTNKGTADEKTVETSNAIYVAKSYSNKTPELKLQSVNKGTIQFDDQIDGDVGYRLLLTGDDSSKILLNNSVKNAKVTMDTANVNLGKNDVFAASDVTVNSGTLGFVNGIAEAQNMQSLNINGNTNLALDVDLAGERMDTLPDGTVVSPDTHLNVSYLNLLNDAVEDRTSILFAENSYKNAVSYAGENPTAYSPIYKYNVSYNPDDGMFSFVRGSSAGNPSDNFNPSVLAPSVATQAGAYTTQLQTFNYAFQHSDAFMNIPYLDRVSIKNRNKYALSPTSDATDVGTFSPLLTHDESAGIWMKPYASFESVPLKNGPKVSNINYGTLVGFDSQLKSVSHGFDRVLTGYIGYNGASQRYQGVDAYQNGGILGGTATFYKNNFFNATTLSVGATAGDAKSMYGSENYTMLLAGIANKTGYNFEFKEGRIILQPSMLISYSFVNTFDYNNAAGVRIKSDPLNAIQLAPGLKLIGNTKNGWQPYIGVSMVWNLLDKTKVTADDVRLPEMSIKPYVQYGVGVQKRWSDKITAYAQAMLHSGGRNGVSLTCGLRWAIGKK